MPTALALEPPVTAAAVPPTCSSSTTSPAIRESLETLLSLEGFDVTLAVDGPTGLEALSRAEYDLLLLDLALPGESGIDLLPRITENFIPTCPSS